ncbi:MAG: RIP metalloprotease RseP [Gammaproteobacteria bacterium]|jgi:regulator of sigma E protease|nr:RIP metalloprotease RseP [Gammaproteobacteria bacterium]
MIDILQSALAFIVILGILITFHEYGHFWVARKCDVKILRFSVGFGRPLWKRSFGDDQTEFVIAALPLGGYVKMLDEREGPVEEQDKERAFNNKSLTQRIMIVVAGPLFNFIFAIFAYWAMYMIGINDFKPVIGEIEMKSIAAESGFRSGDRILQVDGRKTPTWSSVIDTTVANVVNAREVVFTVSAGQYSEREITIDLSKISIDEMASGQLFKAIGLHPERPVIPAIIGEIIEGGSAEAVGMQVGDKVLKVDDDPVKDWINWVEIIRANPQQALQVDILRNAEPLTLAITPALVVEGGQEVGKIGAGLDQSYLQDTSNQAIESYALFPALYKAVEKTADMSIMTLRILGKMIVGEASVKNLSGPISIAQYAGKTANLGIAVFLGFMAVISVSLGVLNLLPIPLLDGGHLFYYLIEMVKGSPPSESFQIAGQQFGLIVLLGLMSIALYNDILRVVG